MRTLDDLDVAGKRVLVRVDFNVPLEGRRITDDARIRAALPTLKELREKGARLVLAAHLGRPKDREPELSLRPVAERLSELLGEEVTLARFLDRVPDGGDVVMLENVRYEQGETKNDVELAQALRVAGRRVRQRRVRRRPPRALLDRGGRAPAPERRGAAARARGVDAARHPRGAAAPARRGRRRRQGDRQDRRAGGVPRARRRGPGRRRDVLPVLRRPGPLGRRVAVRGGGDRARAEGAGRREAAAPEDLVLGQRVQCRHRGAGARRRRRARAGGWGWTSARARPAATPTRCGRPGRCSGTARWGRSSSSRSRPARARWPRRSRRARARRWSAAATRRRRSRSSGSPTR